MHARTRTQTRIELVSTLFDDVNEEEEGVGEVHEGQGAVGERRRGTRESTHTHTPLRARSRDAQATNIRGVISTNTHHYIFAQIVDAGVLFECHFFHGCHRASELFLHFRPSLSDLRAGAYETD